MVIFHGDLPDEHDSLQTEETQKKPRRNHLGYPPGRASKNPMVHFFESKVQSQLADGKQHQFSE